MDRTLPCEGRNAGSIPARSTHKDYAEIRYLVWYNEITMELLKNIEEKTPEWIRPDFHNERGELERVVRDFLTKDPTPQNIAEVIEVLNRAQVIQLSDVDWELLENTDSFHNISAGQIEEARRKCERYNEELEEENKRDFEAILNGFRQGNKMECPLILQNSDGKLHLVSGNTRLMIARALGIRPEVIIGKIK
jgi:hypothetical protein